MAKVIAVARSASDAILEIYRRADIEVSDKSDRSPLTLADLAADRVIGDGLNTAKQYLTLGDNI